MLIALFHCVLNIKCFAVYIKIRGSIIQHNRLHSNTRSKAELHDDFITHTQALNHARTKSRCHTELLLLKALDLKLRHDFVTRAHCECWRTLIRSAKPHKQDIQCSRARHVTSNHTDITPRLLYRVQRASHVVVV